MWWNLQLNIILLFYNLPKYILISKRKKDVNCTGLICFILTNLFIQRFYFLYVLLSLSNCWLAHLIFQDDKQSIFFKDYAMINSIWNGFHSNLCLTLPFTRYCSEIYHGFPRGILKDHCVHAFVSKQSVIPKYWGHCSKNHLLGTDETIMHNL